MKTTNAWTANDHQALLERALPKQAAELRAAREAAEMAERLSRNPSTYSLEDAKRDLRVATDILAAKRAGEQVCVWEYTYKTESEIRARINLLIGEVEDKTVMLSELATLASETRARKLAPAIARRVAAQAAWHAAVDTMPSQQAVARKRSIRAKLAEVKDDLAGRKPGYVLGLLAGKNANKLAEKAKRAATRAHRAHEDALRPVFNAFAEAYHRCNFRGAKETGWVDRATGHVIRISLTTPEGWYAKPRTAQERPAPSASSDSDVVWDSRKTRSGTLSTHTFVLRPSWVEDVASHRFDVVDGCLTIDAGKRWAEDRAEVYTATWVRQGRGTSLVTESGVILRLDSQSPWVHGESFEAALRTAKRRASAERTERERSAQQRTRDAAIAAGNWAAVWPGVDLDVVMVTLDHSVAVGNCRTGSKAWVAAHMPERIDAESVSAAEVLAAAAEDHTSTRRMAVAAVHRAVLKSRKQAA